MNLLNKIRLFNNVLNNNLSQIRINEDIYGLQLLNKVLNDGNFLPITSMSLRPFVLAFLLNEILVNKRRRIIEFGAGISTIMFARLFKINNLPSVIVSIEENIDWLRLLETMLKEEGLQDYVKMIHAPVEEKIFMGSVSHWYQNDILQEALKPYGPFDMVMIDGPTAYNDRIALSRYFAVPFLQEFLLKEHVIFLDDANRQGEKHIMQLWKDEHGKHFKIFAETLGVHYQGSHFESNPLKSASIQQL